MLPYLGSLGSAWVGLILSREALHELRYSSSNYDAHHTVWQDFWLPVFAHNLVQHGSNRYCPLIRPSWDMRVSQRVCPPRSVLWDLHKHPRSVHHRPQRCLLPLLDRGQSCSPHGPQHQRAMDIQGPSTAQRIHHQHGRAARSMGQFHHVFHFTQPPRQLAALPCS